ncbi:hypothetical protein EV178_002403 [Coemansia sp. RSA 1646]|nr:hypothetical protein EV178_002403 [Coemansia sp. RSA 1646]
MASYAGGRDIFRPTNTDIPPPGAYDVYSPENPYKKYGFLSQEERFKAERMDERGSGSGGGYVDTNTYGGRSLSRANSQTSSRRTLVGNTTMTALRAEESRYKRELEHYQKLLLQQQHDASKDVHRLGEKIKLSEEKIKELVRDRTELKQRLLKRESELRTKEKERDLLAERFEKQQQAAAAPANPKTEKALRERSEAANAMCTKLKAALDRARQVNEEDRRKIRQLESNIRRLDQERDSIENYLKQMKEQDYPRQLHRAERELRIQEEQYRESVRKLEVSLQEAKDKASRYMNELGEATVHATALENELQLAKERELDSATDQSKQLETALAQLNMTQSRLSDLERLAKQKSDESERMLKAANEHISGLNSEITRLEEEREEVQREMQGKIRELMRDYKSAKREFESSVKGADDERTKRLTDTQLRLEKATKETIGLKSEISELRGILLKKEMAWKNKQLELESDLQAAASDFEAMQTQMDDQHRKFDEHLRSLEDKARKKESAWNNERTGILEKLDTAHKDGFKLRDELDTLHKEAAQIKADCDADLKRMKLDLDDALAEAEAQKAKWEHEHTELASAHEEEVAQLKEECNVLEQRLQDDRFSLENQLQDVLDELEALRESRDDELGQRDDQLAKVVDELDDKTKAVSELEEQLDNIDSKYAAQLGDLRAALEESQTESQNSIAALQEELLAAHQRTEDIGKQAESEHHEMEDLRIQNSALNARVQELQVANEELANDCYGLQSTVDELAEGAIYADEEKEDALTHYVQLMQELDRKHRAEKAQWGDERRAMRDRLDRYRYRDAMYSIQQDYLLDHMDISEAARVHMVNEARALYDELQDQTAVAYECGDAGAELADDLERALSISSAAGGPEASVEVEGLEAEVRVLVQHNFIDAIEQAQAARVARVRIESELQELRYMRLQGHMVETASEMSAQFKLERAKLESDLANARTDYRGLQDLASTNRSAFERQLAELQDKLSEAQTKAGASEDVKKLTAENTALSAELAKLEEVCVELESRLEAGDGEMDDDERAAYEHQNASLDAQVERMSQVLEQCEVDMTAQVDQIGRMRQYIAEIESERAILAEQSQFQINWLRENYTMAYNELDNVLNNNGGHTNLRQRIRYVETLKTQILTLKKENFECSRERDRLKHNVNLLKSELDAYKEVSDAEALRVRSRVRGRPVHGRSNARAAAGGRKTMGGADDADGQRSVLVRRGAAIASKALEEARQLSQRQMVVADD